MRKIAANLIFPISGPPIKNGYLVLSDDGEVLDVCTSGDRLVELAGMEYYSGILVPGFVNTHCHIELSHLKGLIPEGIGIKRFIKNIPLLRNQPHAIIEQEAQKALRYMWSRGINAVGDIINTNHTLAIKQSSPVKLFNFIELFNENDIETQEILKAGTQLYHELIIEQMYGNLTPHSFYGTGYDLIKGLLSKTLINATFSIHYKEMALESRVDLEQRLQMILNSSVFERLLLVHNIYLQHITINQFKEQFGSKMDQVYWVLCPNSNLFVGKKLPPVMEMYRNQLQICLGTDSLASNHQLSILNEMVTLHHYFPEIAFNDIITWATLNGAKSLGMEKELGSFDKGKKPGVLLITGYDFKKTRLYSSAEVTRLL